VTPTPVHRVYVNEVLPYPGAAYALGGDPLAGAFAELYNAGEEDEDLSWWRLVVSDTVQLTTYRIPFGVSLGAGEYLALYRQDHSLPLLVATGEVRVYSWEYDAKTEADVYTLQDSLPLPGATPGASWQRYGDGAATTRWIEWPSPGQSNTRATPTPTATATP
jgi:hypothetical protein